MINSRQAAEVGGHRHRPSMKVAAQQADGQLPSSAARLLEGEGPSTEKLLDW